MAIWDWTTESDAPIATCTLQSSFGPQVIIASFYSYNLCKSIEVHLKFASYLKAVNLLLCGKNDAVH